MKKENAYKAMLLFFTCIQCIACHTQKPLAGNAAEDVFTALVPKSLSLVRETCNCGTSGYRYRISYDSIYSKSKTYCDYSYRPVYKAADSLKILLLEEIITKLYDTAISCKPVVLYGSKHTDQPPLSTTYNLQVDALYNINFIAFGVGARQYSPYPVLYDTLLKKEINNDPAAINEVVEIYRNWFEAAQKNGFKNYLFPLLGTRYSWYGAYNYVSAFKNLPRDHSVDNLGEQR